MDIGKITEPLMQINIIQWCDTKEQILDLMTLSVITFQDMLEAGCHWTSPKLPIKADLLEVVSEVHLSTAIFNLVKFKSEYIDTGIGYALLKVM